MGGTVAFLLTDVEHSTQLWDHDGTEMGANLARHDAIIAVGVARNNGRLVKARGEGDSHFTVFDSALDAALAALEIQRDLQDEEWTTAGPLRVRMAIHAGEVEERGEDYYGQEVNRAARLRGIGHGGQILVSAPVRELIHYRLPAHCWLIDLGEHRLRDLLRAEHVYQLAAEGLILDYPRLTSLDAAKTNLPSQLTNFVGREDDIESVRMLLVENRLVTLLGPGGCGKTRLAVQAAAESLDAYPDGVWFADLSPVEEESAIERAVAASLPMKLSPAMDLKQNILSYLEGKKLLLVIDNCEHLGDAPAKFVSWMLRSTAEVRCLATSRRVLGVGSEHSYLVRPLTRPPSGAATRKKVLDSESARLLVDRAWAKAPAFHITDGNAGSVGSLCTALEGIPLAIELAASRLKLLSPEQLYSRLRKSLDLLKGGSTDGDARHRTLRATIDWSYQLLRPAESDLLCRLSLLPAGCSLEVAEIAGADLDEDVLDLLEGLVNNSLVQVEGTGAPRYRMLETIRQYCAEKIVPGVEEGVFERLLPWAIEFARTTKPLLLAAEQKQTLARIESEYENLSACLSWAYEHPDSGNSLLSLACELDRFWLWGGMVNEGTQWLEEGLSLSGGEPIKRATALRSVGAFARHVRDYAKAKLILTQSVDILREIGDKQALSGALSNMAMTYADAGDLDESTRCFLEALDLAREVGDIPLSGLILQNLGWVENSRGHLEQAMAYYSQALSYVNDKPEGKYTLAVLMSNIASIHRRTGELKEAAHALKQSIEISLDLNNSQLLGDHVMNLAQVAYAEQHYEMAARLLACCRRAWKLASFEPGGQNAEIEAELEADLREELRPSVLADALGVAAGMAANEIAEYALSSVELIVL